MSDVKFLSGLIGGVVFCYLLISLGVVDRVDGIPGTEEEPVFAIPTYLSFISAMMTAVTAVLAAVAIGIGVIAAYTIREIKEQAEFIARKTVDKLVEEKLSDETIKKRISDVAFEGFTQRRSEDLLELEENFDPDDTGER